jgi:hypothetical protein
MIQVYERIAYVDNKFDSIYLGQIAHVYIEAEEEDEEEEGGQWR